MYVYSRLALERSHSKPLEPTSPRTRMTSATYSLVFFTYGATGTIIDYARDVSRMPSTSRPGCASLIWETKRGTLFYCAKDASSRLELEERAGKTSSRCRRRTSDYTPANSGHNLWELKQRKNDGRLPMAESHGSVSASTYVCWLYYK